MQNISNYQLNNKKKFNPKFDQHTQNWGKMSVFYAKQGEIDFIDITEDMSEGEKLKAQKHNVIKVLEQELQALKHKQISEYRTEKVKEAINPLHPNYEGHQEAFQDESVRQKVMDHIGEGVEKMVEES